MFAETEETWQSYTATYCTHTQKKAPKEMLLKKLPVKQIFKLPPS